MNIPASDETQRQAIEHAGGAMAPRAVVSGLVQRGARYNFHDGTMEVEHKPPISLIASLAGPHQATLSASASTPSDLARSTTSEPTVNEDPIMEYLTTTTNDTSRSALAEYTDQNGSFVSPDASSPLSSILSSDLLQMGLDLNFRQSPNRDQTKAGIVYAEGDNGNHRADKDFNLGNVGAVASSDDVVNEDAVHGEIANDTNNDDDDDLDADAKVYEDDEVMLLLEPAEN